MKKIALIWMINFILIFPLLALNEKDQKLPSSQPITEYRAKDFSYLIGNVGFSDELLKMHFTLYQGYVKNTNLLIQLISNYANANQTHDYQYQALKRRFGWEFDGMRLHELYFGNMMGGKPSLDRNSSLFRLIVRDFGSYDNWKRDFIGTGMMRGVGWSILYYDPKAGRLFNTWINEHDLGHLAEGDILLVMDVWEHAYMPEFGLDRAKYIDIFFKNIDWEVVLKRFQNAVARDE